jgi:hypothetical protein
VRNGKAEAASFPVQLFTRLSEDTPELFGFSLAALGIVPGTLVEVTDSSGCTRLVDVSSSPLPFQERCVP